MLIVCPSCAISYAVEPEGLLPEGRYVRCQGCHLVWHALPSHADRLLAAAAALGPEPIRSDGPVAVPAQASQPELAAAADADPAGPSKHAADMVDDEPLMDAASPAAGGDVQPGDVGLAMMAEDEGAAEDAPLLPAFYDDDPAVADEAFADEPDQFTDVEAPPIAPVDLDEGRPPIAIDQYPRAYSVTPLEAIRGFAWPDLGRASSWSLPRWPVSRLHTGIVALLIVDCLLVGWRGTLVRAFPQTDSFYRLVGLPVNQQGLAFEGVSTATERHEGVPVLVVEGNVVNSAGKFVDVPRLKFVVRNAAGHEIYSWTAVPSRTPLPPGEAVSFRTRLASPPPDACDVLLRFVDRRDIVAAAR